MEVGSSGSLEMEGAMSQEWVKRLVCPETKKKFRITGDKLVSLGGKYVYTFSNGIANFLSEKEIHAWDGYQLKAYSSEPMPPHKYYTRYTDGWRIMLDLGCGDGVMSADSSSKVDHIFCANPDRSALEILKRRNIDNMHPICCFGEKLPFPDNFFDGIFNIFVIEHLKDSLPILNEMHRVLKSGGTLIISTDTKYYYQYLRVLMEWRKNGWKRWKSNDPTHFNLMTPSRLRKYLKESNFKIIEENIDFLTGRWGYFKFLPHIVWEAWLSSFFVFKCAPLEKENCKN